MLPRPNPVQLTSLVPAGTCLIGYRGSVAHGTYQVGRSKDVDIGGVMIAPLTYYFGLANYLGENKAGNGCFEEKCGDFDAVTYEIRRFVELCATGNPNTLPLLWMVENDHFYLKIDEIGRLLVENRTIFSSKRVFSSFTGMAAGQIGRAKNNKTPDFFRKAAHCIRMLRMCREFLTTGVLTVFRPDAADILSIKDGEWSTEKIEYSIDVLFDLCRIARDRSELPENPDMNAVNNLLIECIGRSRF